MALVRLALVSFPPCSFLVYCLFSPHHTRVFCRLEISMSDLRESLTRLPFLRLITLRILRSLEQDITIRNTWTGDHLKPGLYRHKGYWYHGAGREKQTMETFRRLIR